MGKINTAGLTGFFMCLVAIIYGIATNGGLQTILSYLHIPSLILTVGGSLFAVLATADSFEDFRYGLRGLIDAYQKPETTVDEVSEVILNLSDVARKEGLLGLESVIQSETEYLKKGLTLVIDGSEPALVKDIMEAELFHKQEQSAKQVQFWKDFGAYAPAWGMVGTLIGLINMMKFMGDDASAIGAGMSLALITTLYGSIVANWICIPISRKLQKNSEKNFLVMELIVEGVLSIQAGENPRIIKEKLKAILIGEDWEGSEENNESRRS